MMRRLASIFGGALLLLAWGCGKDNTMPTQPGVAPTPTPMPGAAAAHVVAVGQNGFQFVDSVSGGSTTSIKAGETVQWNFVSSTGHSTTSGTCCTKDGTWDSGVMSSPATFSHRFDAAGSFPYFCVVHGSMMTGMVNVSP